MLTQICTDFGRHASPKGRHHLQSLLCTIVQKSHVISHKHLTRGTWSQVDPLPSVKPLKNVILQRSVEERGLVMSEVPLAGDVTRCSHGYRIVLGTFFGKMQNSVIFMLEMCMNICIYINFFFLYKVLTLCRCVCLYVPALL